MVCKAKIFKHAAILLLLAGWVSSCGNDSDMSKIDFSNIENLYEQPLPVIKKCVQGKWKVYCACMSGIVFNVSYPQNEYIEFKKDHYISSNEEDGSQSITYYTWEKQLIDNWRSSLNGKETYMICDKKQENALTSRGYFESIKNDTLSYGSYQAPIFFRAVKVKEFSNNN